MINCGNADDKWFIVDTRKAKSIAFYSFKVAITLISIWYVVQQINPQELASTLASIAMISLIITFILMLAQNLSCGIRWWYCCHIQGLSFKPWWCIKTYFGGVFVALIFPGSLGLDGYRIVKAKLEQQKLSVIVSAITQEKVFTTLALLLFVIPFPHWFSQGGEELMLFYLISTGVALLSLVIIFVVESPAVELFRSLLQKVRLSVLIDVIKFMLPAKSSLMIGLTTASVSNLLLILAYSCLWHSLFNEWPSMSLLLLFVPLILVTALPVSIGGWGVRESTLIILFSPLGYNTEKLVAIGVAFGLIQTLSAIPGFLNMLSASKQQPLNTKSG